MGAFNVRNLEKLVMHSFQRIHALLELEILLGKLRLKIVGQIHNAPNSPVIEYVRRGHRV